MVFIYLIFGDSGTVPESGKIFAQSSRITKKKMKVYFH